MSGPRSTEHGAALITALVVAALATAAAVAMASRTQLEIGRVTVQVESARRRSLIDSVEAQVRAVLHTDAQSGREDSADDDWATADHTVSVGDSEAKAVVRDEQRLFNLNNLAFTARNPGSRAPRSVSGAGLPSDASPAAPGSDPEAATGTQRAAPNPIPGNAGANSNGSTLSVETAGASAAANTAAGASEASAPQFEERTRYVLDRSVARAISGRGRPSDVAAVAGGGGAPRVAETYLEPVTPQQAVEAANPAQGDANFTGEVSGNAGALPEARMNTGADPVASAPASAIAGPSPTVTLPPNELWIARFSLLLKRLEISEPVLQPILDWLDSDAEVRFPNGAEDAYYLKLDTPYRAANRPFADISELLLVRGVTPEVYERLAPFVTALPVHTEVNINTASPEVLMSLAPTIDRSIAELIISTREVQAFRSTDMMLSLPMLAAAEIDDYGIGVGSEYFEVTTTVTTGEAIEQSRALIGRVRNGRSRIVARRNGYFDD